MEYLVIFFCLAITLHNIEEAIWLPQWSQQPSKFQKSVTLSEFHFAVIIITMLAYLSAFSYLYVPQSAIAKWIFTGFLGSMIFNAIFPHLLVTVLTKTYAPGLLTGILLNIPINTLIIYEMLERNLIIWKEVIISTAIIGVMLLSLIPLLFKLSRKLLSFT